MIFIYRCLWYAILRLIFKRCRSLMVLPSSLTGMPGGILKITPKRSLLEEYALRYKISISITIRYLCYFVLSSVSIMMPMNFYSATCNHLQLESNWKWELSTEQWTRRFSWFCLCSIQVIGEIGDKGSCRKNHHTNLEWTICRLE